MAGGDGDALAVTAAPPADEKPPLDPGAEQPVPAEPIAPDQVSLNEFVDDAHDMTRVKAPLVRLCVVAL